MHKILIITLNLGIILIILSLNIPRFVNNNDLAVQQIEDKFCDNQISESEYKKQYLNHTTSKYKIQNFGVGLTTISAAFIILFLLLKVKSFRKLKNIQSLHRKLWYFLLSNIAHLLITTGMIAGIMLEDKQYPIYDNSGIAIMGFISSFWVTLIIMNIILAVNLSHERVKSEIFAVKLFKRGLKIGERFWSLLIIYNTIILLYSVRYGEIYTIVGCIMAIYVILSLRSELLEPKPGIIE